MSSFIPILSEAFQEIHANNDQPEQIQAEGKKAGQKKNPLRSPSGALFDKLNELGFIDEKGDCIKEKFTFPLPSLSAEEVEKIRKILSDPFLIKMRNGLEYTIYLNDLFLYLLNENSMAAVMFIGSTLPWLFGPLYRSAFQLLGIADITPYLENFHKPSDYDFRLIQQSHDTNASSHYTEKVVSFLEAELKKAHASPYITYLTITQNALTKFCKIPETGNRYAIAAFGDKTALQAEIMPVKELVRESLFVLDSLKINIINLILGISDHLVPQGNLLFGWQALIDLTTRKMRAEDIDSIDHNGWIKFVANLSKGFTGMQPGLWENLYKKAGFIEEQLIKYFNDHPSFSRDAKAAFIINLLVHFYRYVDREAFISFRQNDCLKCAEIQNPILQKILNLALDSDISFGQVINSLQIFAVQKAIQPDNRTKIYLTEHAGIEPGSPISKSVRIRLENGLNLILPFDPKAALENFFCRPEFNDLFLRQEEIQKDPSDIDRGLLNTFLDAVLKRYYEKNGKDFLFCYLQLACLLPYFPNKLEPILLSDFSKAVNAMQGNAPFLGSLLDRFPISFSEIIRNLLLTAPIPLNKIHDEWVIRLFLSEVPQQASIGLSLWNSLSRQDKKRLASGIIDRLGHSFQLENCLQLFRHLKENKLLSFKEETKYVFKLMKICEASSDTKQMCKLAAIFEGLLAGKPEHGRIAADHSGEILSYLTGCKDLAAEKRIAMLFQSIEKGFLKNDSKCSEVFSAELLHLQNSAKAIPYLNKGIAATFSTLLHFFKQEAAQKAEDKGKLQLLSGLICKLSLDAKEEEDFGLALKQYYEKIIQKDPLYGFDKMKKSSEKSLTPKHRFELGIVAFKELLKNNKLKDAYYNLLEIGTDDLAPELRKDLLQETEAFFGSLAKSEKFAQLGNYLKMWHTLYGKKAFTGLKPPQEFVSCLLNYALRIKNLQFNEHFFFLLKECLAYFCHEEFLVQKKSITDSRYTVVFLHYLFLAKTSYPSYIIAELSQHAIAILKFLIDEGKNEELGYYLLACGYFNLKYPITDEALKQILTIIENLLSQPKYSEIRSETALLFAEALMTIQCKSNEVIRFLIGHSQRERKKIDFNTYTYIEIFTKFPSLEGDEELSHIVHDQLSLKLKPVMVKLNQRHKHDTAELSKTYESCDPKEASAWRASLLHLLKRSVELGSCNLTDNLIKCLTSNEISLVLNRKQKKVFLGLICYSLFKHALKNKNKNELLRAFEFFNKHYDFFIEINFLEKHCINILFESLIELFATYSDEKLFQENINFYFQSLFKWADNYERASLGEVQNLEWQDAYMPFDKSDILMDTILPAELAPVYRHIYAFADYEVVHIINPNKYYEYSTIFLSKLCNRNYDRLPNRLTIINFIKRKVIDLSNSIIKGKLLESLIQDYITSIAAKNLEKIDLICAVFSLKAVPSEIKKRVFRICFDYFCANDEDIEYFMSLSAISYDIFTLEERYQEFRELVEREMNQPDKNQEKIWLRILCVITPNMVYFGIEDEEKQKADKARELSRQSLSLLVDCISQRAHEAVLLSIRILKHASNIYENSFFSFLKLLKSKIYPSILAKKGSHDFESCKMAFMDLLTVEHPLSDLEKIARDRMKAEFEAGLSIR